MSSCRSTIAGKDPAAFLQREVERMGIKDRQKLLQDAGITVYIPAEQGLAMCTTCSLPWKKMREIRRYDKYIMCM